VLTTPLRTLLVSYPSPYDRTETKKLLGETDENAEISVERVLDTFGIAPAEWCVKAGAIGQNWNRKRFLYLLAADYTERVLSIFEQRRLEDPRPREAIQTLRAYAEGRAIQKCLRCAQQEAKLATEGLFGAPFWAGLSASEDSAWFAAHHALQAIKEVAPKEAAAERATQIEMFSAYLRGNDGHES